MDVSDHPVCAFLRWLRGILLMAQPPLLYQEGNTLVLAIDSHLHRPPLQFALLCLSPRRSVLHFPHELTLFRAPEEMESEAHF